MLDYFDASFFVAFAFAIVIIALLRMKIPSRIASLLDERAEKIARELEEAKSLREEAESLLATYQKRALEAEREALTLVNQAEEDARRIADEAETALQNRLAHRLKQVEEKMARSEAHLIRDMRTHITELSIMAASLLIADKLPHDKAGHLIDDMIGGLAEKLN